MKLLIKETFVTIKKSLKRFISILLIVLLGVGFFAGIKATSPDMKKTISEYYKKTNFQDIELLSDWGITEDEIEVLKKEYNAEEYYSFDSVIKTDVEEVAKVFSYNPDKKLNKLTLTEGRFPLNEDECVIDAIDKHTHKIGDTLTIESDNLKIKNLKIVGVVKSPIYTSLQRGTTNLLTGDISYFIYTLESNFDMEYYTNVGIYLNEEMFNNKYDNKLKTVKEELEKLTNNFKEERYLSEKNKALEEYNKAKNKFEKEKNNSLNQIKKAKNEIQKAKYEYNSGINNLKIEEEKFNETYNTNKKEIEDNINSLNELLSQIDFLENQINNIEYSLFEKEQEINNSFDENEKNLLVAEKNILNENLVELRTQYEKLPYNKDELNNMLKDLEEKLILLDNGKKLFEEEVAKTKLDLSKAKVKIEGKEKELISNEKKLKKEFEKAEEELNETLSEIEKLEKPEWYILDRESNIGFYQYNQDIDRIKKLGQVFPLVFFVVAVLICLTSMTRMIEEERNQLGTLKSLGFTNMQILFKYILYALIATIIGAIIGLLIGFNLLPPIIFNMYSIMYNIGDIITEFNLNQAFFATGIALLCTILATVFVCIKSLREQPSELMRPKAIKSGKRIILERIPFIWKRLDFNHKVTMRNVFRYKKRMLMTIVGIAGCTGLIISGFGLKNCLNGMVNSQYNEVFKYELEVTLNEAKNNDNILEKIKEIPKIKEIARVQKEAIELKNYNTKQQIQLIVPLDDLNNFISLKNRKTKNNIKLDGVVVTEKLASLLELEKNDILEISAEKDYTLKVKDITENYLSH